MIISADLSHSTPPAKIPFPSEAVLPGSQGVCLLGAWLGCWRGRQGRCLPHAEYFRSNCRSARPRPLAGGLLCPLHPAQGLRKHRRLQGSIDNRSFLEEKLVSQNQNLGKRKCRNYNITLFHTGRNPPFRRQQAVPVSLCLCITKYVLRSRLPASQPSQYRIDTGRCDKACYVSKGAKCSLTESHAHLASR